MKAIVIYKSKYGSTKAYAQRIARCLGCEAVDAKSVRAKELEGYDTIIYGGGLYAEIIGGVSLITKNYDMLSDKKLAVFTTGLTPTDCREYYDDMVASKNFKPHMLEKIRIFNFPGKMIMGELTAVHRAALKTLKRIMSSKENPTEMEAMLIKLCDADGDFSDFKAIDELIDYVIE